MFVWSDNTSLCFTFFFNKDQFHHVYFIFQKDFTHSQVENFKKGVTMKFLIALTVLVSTSVFAETMNRDLVKCYDAAQGEDREVVYKLAKHDGHIRLVYPRDLAQELVRDDGCLETMRTDEAINGNWIRFCREEGQRINGLVPVEVKFNHEEETVYCEKKIWHWLGNDDLM
jgi:hypothetical protein